MTSGRRVRFGILLDHALKQTDGNQKEAAALLGLKYHQMRYYLKEHGVG